MNSILTSKKLYFSSLLLVLLFCNSFLFAQVESFSVSKTTFTSSVGDDFSPVFYKDGIVYCSNSINNAVVSIKSENENLFNILFVQEKDSGSWKSPELFSNELTTILNDGPCTFNSKGNIVYFARNNLIEGKFKDINNPANKLGIYRAELINGVWSNITPLPYNNSDYSLGTPSLSPEGKRIFFASDMPGGYGGTDLYYCDLKDTTWGKPVNLGPEINTALDESYPYACISGRVFFSSNGHGGFGGKDIFYTMEKNGKWIKPIHLQSEINSPADDYGIITDKNFEWGYFSSNRRNNTDIFSFRTNSEQFGPCDTLGEYKKCYIFYDERFTDTLHLQHLWDFGHGIRKKGIQVEQCFSQPGNYAVVLTIINHIADSTFETKSVYNFEVEPPSSPYISCEKAGVVNDNALITAFYDTSNSESYTSYWNLGGGYKEGNRFIEQIFPESGIYTIELGLKGKADESGIIPKTCYSKSITIVDDIQQKANLIFEQTETDKTILASIRSGKKSGNNAYWIKTSLLASMEAIASDKLSSSFDSLSGKFLSFNETNELVPENYPTLNRLVNLLKNNPNITLQIAIHQDSKGTQKSNQELSDRIAETLTSGLLKQGIEQSRFNCIGYGDTRPLKGNNAKDTQILNKRIEFILVNN